MAQSFSVGSPSSAEAQGMLPRAHSSQLLRIAGVISILVTIGNVVADLVLQYNSQGYDGNVAFLGIATWRVFTGHFLGVFLLPLQIVGYWFVCTLMLERSPRLFRVLFWIMAYGIIMGTVFHGIAAPATFVMQAASVAPSAAQSSWLSLEALLTVAVVPLVIVFFVSYLAMWGIFIVSVLAKPAPFPRWMVFFAPALLSVLITVLYMSHVVPVVGNVLYPVVLSLPHLVFYVVCTVVVWRRDGAKSNLRLMGQS